MRATLLVEILTEELPPKALRNLGISFAGTVHAQLVAQGFAEPATPYSAYATPRRLGVSIRDVADRQAEQTIERKGPAVNAGLDAAGNPTPALLGFAKSCGVPIEKLEKKHDGKQECFVFSSSKAGLALNSLLAATVTDALKKLPAAKLMRWGESEVQFIRPVHGLVMMHGAEVVPGSVFGLASGNSTWGHRFMGIGRVTLASADDYATALHEQGCVIADFAEREKQVREQLRKGADAASAGREASKVLGEDTGLLEEVTALVEWPATYPGTFSEEFLRVPPECLVLSMQQHQKYFPLADAQGKLLPRFLMVSNLAIEASDNIIQGNERVLRARLADATFFFDQDRKTSLADRVPRLANVVFHNKLGNQLQRVQRIEKLAGAIARQLGADPILAERAAYLCKADLLTDMVGEFPELQGIMGQYYARHDLEPEAVARAIEAHYHPRFAGDTLPGENVGICVALADKLDATVGIFAVGQVPTGDKDPYGLRRQTLGILRMLSEQALALDIFEALRLSAAQFPLALDAGSVVEDIYVFMLDRLKFYLRDKGFSADEVESVVSQSPTRIDLVVPRLEAVRSFRQLPESIGLSAANKRIRNILKKTRASGEATDPGIMTEGAEKRLFESVLRLEPLVNGYMNKMDYAGALQALAGARGEVDTFFEDVMVMVDDAAVRNNRVALLRRLDGLMNQVADISKL